MSRTRTGCMTCVQRHLKCDESKPICLRCANGNWACQWREKVLKIIQVVTYPSSETAPLGELEQRALGFFYYQTIPDLAKEDYNRNFWSRYLLGAARSNRLVFHMGAAIGALHERLCDGSRAALRLALQHYGKAIHLARGLSTNTTSKYDVLLACLLFSVFESMGQGLNIALTHLKCGMRIFAGCDTQYNEAASDIPYESLKLVFMRYESQLLEYGDAAVYSLSKLLTINHASISGMRGGLQHVESLFDKLVCRILYTIQEQNLPVHRQRNDLSPGKSASRLPLMQITHNYYAWGNMFDSLVHNFAQNSLVERQEGYYSRLLVLQTWRIVLYIALHVDLREGEIGYDLFLKDFQTVLALAKEFILINAGSKTSTQPAREYLVTKTTSSGTTPSNVRSIGPISTRTSMLGLCPAITPIAQQSYEHFRFMRATSATLLQFASTRSGSSLPEAEDVFSKQVYLRTTFSLARGIVNPLYICITRCRHKVTRSLALSLLSQCNRREGIWDSRLASFIASCAVDIEEHGAKMAIAQALNQELTAVSATTPFNILNIVRIRHVEPRIQLNVASPRFYFVCPSPIHPGDGNGEAWIEKEIRLHTLTT